MKAEFIALTTKANTATGNGVAVADIEVLKADCARTMKSNTGIAQMYVYQLVGIVKQVAPPVEFEKVG
jgi:hypothetical protein